MYNESVSPQFVCLTLFSTENSTGRRRSGGVLVHQFVHARVHRVVHHLETLVVQLLQQAQHRRQNVGRLK